MAALAEPVLRLRDLSKSYGASQILDGVSFDVARNSVVGIIGENGAGKSTLFNVISGISQPDRGRVELAGREVRPRDYREVTRLGISRVFQEQALIPSLPVYENIALGNEDQFTLLCQFVARRRMIELAREVVAAVGLDIDVRRTTSSFDFSVRQAIEIARACLVPQLLLGIDYPIVLLDEPTSALARIEEERLFDLIDRLRRHGSILFVSHRLGEVLRVSDVVHVLKDGALVATFDPAQCDETSLHAAMVGRERAHDYYQESRQRRAKGAAALQVKGLVGAGYGPVDLTVHEGEVVGIGGLLGSGKAALGKGIGGIVAPQGGTVAIGNSAPATPRCEDLIRQGLGYVPAERLAEGLIASQPVAWNVTLASGADRFSTRWGRWRGRAERQVAASYIASLGIRSATPTTPCDRLSGGNQQKVVLARWLCREPRVLILDNPTRGIDAGAKEEIYRLVRTLAEQGCAVLLITDELLELIGLSSRIVVMRRGRIATTIEAPAGDKPSETELVAMMVDDGRDVPPAVLARSA